MLILLMDLHILLRAGPNYGHLLQKKEQPSQSSATLMRFIHQYNEGQFNEGQLIVQIGDDSDHGIEGQGFIFAMAADGQLGA